MIINIDGHQSFKFFSYVSDQGWVPRCSDMRWSSVVRCTSYYVHTYVHSTLTRLVTSWTLSWLVWWGKAITEPMEWWSTHSCFLRWRRYAAAWLHPRENHSLRRYGGIGSWWVMVTIQRQTLQSSLFPAALSHWTKSVHIWLKASIHALSSRAAKEMLKIGRKFCKFDP